MDQYSIRKNDVLSLLLRNNYHNNKLVKQASLLASVLLAQACSGGGNQRNITLAPKPDFVESPSGTFRASTAKNNVLNLPNDNRDLFVYGHEGDDTITTGHGADTIEGRGGNDIINSGGGDDIILGGDGDDTIDGQAGSNDIDGGNGNDTITAGDDGSHIAGGPGNDIISTGLGGDSINGNAGDDTISSSGGNDIINGGDGNDTITITGDSLDILSGGAGNDTINAANSDDILFGEDGNDTLYGGGGDDVINGNIGNDTIHGGDDTDYVRAGEGVDEVYGDGGDDYIIIVGITEEDQFSELELLANSVFGSIGISLNLAQLLAAVNVNGRTTSELEAGEIIDGGTGTNVLVLYGDSDLSIATLINLYEINIIEGTVGMSTVQIAEFGSVESDENSTINLIADDQNLEVDLSSIEFSNLGELTVPDGVTLTMHDISDIEGISNIVSSGNEGYTVRIIPPAGTSSLDIELSGLAETMTGVTSLEVGEGVRLIIESAEDVASLGLEAITGTGQVIFNNLFLTPDELSKLAADLSIGDLLDVLGLTLPLGASLSPAIMNDASMNNELSLYFGNEILPDTKNSTHLEFVDSIEPLITFSIDTQYYNYDH